MSCKLIDIPLFLVRQPPAGLMVEIDCIYVWGFLPAWMCEISPVPPLVHIHKHSYIHVTSTYSYPHHVTWCVYVRMYICIYHVYTYIRIIYIYGHSWNQFRNAGRVLFRSTNGHPGIYICIYTLTYGWRLFYFNNQEAITRNHLYFWHGLKAEISALI